METLTAGSIKHIAKAPKFKGLKLLAQHLKINPSELSEDLRAGAQVDYYYDIMQFAVNRGMPWQEVAKAMQFAADFFYSFINLKLPKVLCALRELGVIYVEKHYLGLENMKKLVHYFTSTVLTHHKLYQLVFREERDSCNRHATLCVTAPTTPQPLANAKSYDLWNYEEQCSVVKKEEETRNLRMEKKERKITAETEELKKYIETKLNEQEVLGEVDLKSVEDLLSHLTANEVNMIQKDAGIKIEKMRNTTEIAIAMQSIEVPAEVMAADIKLSSKTNLGRRSPTRSIGSGRSSGKNSPERKKK